MTALGEELVDGGLINTSDVKLLSEEGIMNLNGSVSVSFSSSGFDNPFNYPVVKALFISLYSTVFLVCCIVIIDCIIQD
ncbi:hypothetical protein RRG08_059126 [Elysia crispata]|uniref:Uncharacterized protein n=1 Tax=Elysia crispata TaxID=231223 RepID=A0AAE0XXG9_9GAST|nr:hypothetical protein RRG08_059126 [Elysia crispata]